MSKRVKKVLYIVKDKEDAQFRYRVRNVMEATGKSSKFEVEYCLLDELEKKKEQLKRADIIVVLRQTAKDNTLLNVLDELRNNGTIILFDLDDLAFDYRDLPVLMRGTNSKNVVYWMGYFWGIRRIAKKVDGFLCTNEFLGDKLKRSFNKPYAVIPNSLNKSQIEISDKLIKKKGNKTGKGFSIGYFSGSPTHARDFRMVEPELTRFLEEHDEAVLEVVGYMDYSDSMKKMMEKGRVHTNKLVDYLKLQELISKVDVNIAPLVVSDFSNCKSELKFFEAGAVETTTIASPTYAFKNAIKDGENGFLAQEGEWYDKINYLYEHADDNKRVAKNAHEYALKHYYGKELLDKTEEAYEFFAK